MTLKELSETKMPFGRHKGETFDDIPLGYLDWLIGNVELREPLKSRLKEYLKHPTIAREVQRELGDDDE